MNFTPYVLGIIKSHVLHGGIVYAVLNYLPVLRRDYRRAMTAFVSVLVVVGALAFYSFKSSQMPLGGYVHAWDSYHYYIGGKYFDELGYLRIYEATLQAAHEQGKLQGIKHLLDQSNYEVVPVESVDLQAAKAHFSPQRWEAFKADIGVFLARGGNWRSLLLDHGYNSPPARTLVTWPLFAAISPTSSGLWTLVQLDQVFLVLSLLLVVRAFGARVALLAIAFLFCNQLAKFDFTGGSILRWDWFCALLAGISFLKMGRGRLAGALFGYAIASRIFPGAFVLFLFVKAAHNYLKKTPDAVLNQCVAACCAFMLVFGAITFAVYSDTAIYQEFVAKMRLHGKHPSTNRVGLPVVDYYGGEKRGTDLGPKPFPFEAFKRRVHQRRTSLPLFVGAVALVLMIAATLRKSAISSMQYGAMVIFFFSAPSHYYYQFLVLFLLVPFAAGRAHLFDVLKIIALMGAMIFGFIFEHMSSMTLVRCHHMSVALLVVFGIALALDLLRAYQPSLERYSWAFSWLEAEEKPAAAEA